MAAANPTSYLYLGSGDFSSPCAKAKQLASVNNMSLQGIVFVATELRTRDQMKTTYAEIDRNAPKAQRSAELGRILGNLYDIQNLGGHVFEGFDALKPYPANLPPNDQGRAILARQFDRIIFENPHTGSYGADGHPTDNMASVTSNTDFLKAVMLVARQFLSPQGVFKLSVCGWPYLAKPSRNNAWDIGMNLGDETVAQDFAHNVHMTHTGTVDEGLQTVSRNNGQKFSARVLTLGFRTTDPNAPKL